MAIKCLYLGVWKDGTGWSTAAQNYILALDSVGIEVVPRALSLTPANDKIDIPPRILELEENDESGCDVCIQHLLPEMMEYHGSFDMNVGMYAYETSHFRNTSWAEHLNLMDQVWVFNQSMIEPARQSHVFKPISVVPHCFDLSDYSQRYKPYPIPDTQGKFVFYTIGEVTRRKNLAGLLRAFHLEFTPDEPVSLLIKGNIVGASPMESNKAIKAIVDEVKRGMRLYPDNADYLNEIIITQWLSKTDMMRLHKTGDCFVLPSYGEAWGIPGFEAMALGNPVILTDEGGPADYIDHEENGMLIPCRAEPVFIRPEEVPVPDIWVGNEDWQSADIAALRHYMRKVYADSELCNKLGENGIDKAYEYSFEKVGAKMKDLLENPFTGNVLQDIRMAEFDDKHNIQNMVRGA